jgi:hypothetical protein
MFTGVSLEGVSVGVSSGFPEGVSTLAGVPSGSGVAGGWVGSSAKDIPTISIGAELDPPELTPVETTV